MSNTGTTGRIPLWLVGVVVGIAALSLLFSLWILCWIRFITLVN
jgi:hypothetical protein